MTKTNHHNNNNHDDKIKEHQRVNKRHIKSDIKVNIIRKHPLIIKTVKTRCKTL